MTSLESQLYHLSYDNLLFLKMKIDNIVSSVENLKWIEKMAQSLNIINEDAIKDINDTLKDMRDFDTNIIATTIADKISDNYRPDDFRIYVRIYSDEHYRTVKTCIIGKYMYYETHNRSGIMLWTNFDREDFANHKDYVFEPDFDLQDRWDEVGDDYIEYGKKLYFSDYCDLDNLVDKIQMILLYLYAFGKMDNWQVKMHISLESFNQL